MTFGSWNWFPLLGVAVCTIVSSSTSNMSKYENNNSKKSKIAIHQIFNAKNI